MPRNLRPSPAMVVAMVALFLSLGGVSYGVATGFIDSREIKDNQVASRDIRQNSIRTEDLRNNEIRGRDIRNSTIRTEDVALNTLTGNDVDESKLAKVASAATADTATSATSASSVATLKTIAPTTVNEGSTATLATKGPFTLTGVCEAAAATSATLRVDTTETASAISRGNSAGDAEFGPGQFEITSINDPAGTDPSIGPGSDGLFSAFAPSGAALTGAIVLWADADAGASGVCKFHGYVVLNG
jgi:hypothetical protein